MILGFDLPFVLQVRSYFDLDQKVSEYMNICLGTVLWFIAQDLIVLRGDGLTKHFSDVNNILDLTFYVLFLVYYQIRISFPDQIIVPELLYK